MRSVLIIITVLLSAQSWAATQPDKEMELAKRFFRSGDLQSAHGYFRDILEKDPSNREAKEYLKKILLSDSPILGNRGDTVLRTRYFIIPYIPKTHDYIKAINIDMFAERWEALIGRKLRNNPTSILLYDSTESYLIASRGEAGTFTNDEPPTISVDPRLSRTEVTEKLQEALTALWLKESMPNAKIPDGLRAGLAGALGAIEEKPHLPIMIPVINLLETAARDDLHRRAATSFVLMLYKLNSKALAEWLASWESSKTPMQDLLHLYKFKDWNEIHVTFHDYLKDEAG